MKIITSNVKEVNLRRVSDNFEFNLKASYLYEEGKEEKVLITICNSYYILYDNYDEFFRDNEIIYDKEKREKILKLHSADKFTQEEMYELSHIMYHTLHENDNGINQIYYEEEHLQYFEIID